MNSLDIFSKSWGDQNFSSWSKESSDDQVFLNELKITIKLRFVQLLSLKPILILLLHLLVSKDLVDTVICELQIKNCFEGEQLSSILF